MTFAGRFLTPGIWVTDEVTTTDNSSDVFACSTDISTAANWADNTAAGNGGILVEGFVMSRDATSQLTDARWFFKKYQYQGGTIASDGLTTDVGLFQDPGAPDFNTALMSVSFTGTTVRIRVRGGANHTQKHAVCMKIYHYAP